MHRIRWQEWQSAAIMVGIGLALALPGDTMSDPLFGALLAVKPEAAWSAILILIGCARAGALIVNGRSPRGSPVVRAVTATCSAALFAGLAVGFAVVGPVGWWAASVYVVLAGFELSVVYRASGEYHAAAPVRRSA